MWPLLIGAGAVALLLKELFEDEVDSGKEIKNASLSVSLMKTSNTEIIWLHRRKMKGRHFPSLICQLNNRGTKKYGNKSAALK